MTAGLSSMLRGMGYLPLDEHMWAVAQALGEIAARRRQPNAVEFSDLEDDLTRAFYAEMLSWKDADEFDL